MIGIIVTGHGHFATGLVNALELLAGATEALGVITNISKFVTCKQYCGTSYQRNKKAYRITLQSNVSCDREYDSPVDSNKQSIAYAGEGAHKPGLDADNGFFGFDAQFFFQSHIRTDD